MRQEKAAEQCGQLEHKPLTGGNKSVLTLSQKPEEGREGANTCVKNESYESFQNPDLTVCVCGNV